MAEFRYRTFRYKIARLDSTLSLQALLEQALAGQPRIGDRKEFIERTEQTRFVTLSHPSGGMLCGTAVVYTQGNHQAIVAVDDGLKEVSVHQIAPPEDERGWRHEFVEGTLFFGVRGNHVMLVQSTSFKALQFEEHINWLLRKTRLSKLAPVAIHDVPPASLCQATWGGVKSVTVRTLLRTTPELPLGDPNENGSTNKGLLVLQQALRVFDRALSEGFRLEELSPDANVELVLQVRQKKRAVRENAALNELAALFSHIDDDAVSVEIDVPNLGRVGREQLQIKQSFRVPADGGLPDANAVFARMQAWLETLLTIDMINP